MKKRIISGVLLFLVVVGMFFARTTWALPIIISFVATLSSFEYIRCIGYHHNFYVTILSCGFSGIVPLGSFIMNRYFHVEFLKVLSIFFVYCVIYFVLISLYSLFHYNTQIKEDNQSPNDYSGKFSNIIQLIGGIVLITSSYWGLMSVSQDEEYGMIYFVLIFAIAWLTDVFAFTFGLLLGKKKLIENVSPKKTIAGAIGGLFGGIIASILVIILSNVFYHEIHYWVILIAFLGSIISQLGDLFFSLCKREYGIKDYGTIFPGHGGMLDRFDSITFVSLYIFSLYLLLIL